MRTKMLRLLFLSLNWCGENHIFGSGVVSMANFHTPMTTLSDGNLIPQIGLVVLRIDDASVAPVVESALEAGYRHIDGTAGYDNEAGVGRALRDAGFTQGEHRRNLWATTKLRDSEQGYDSARKAFERQLGLQLDYVDMYMLHWPTRAGHDPMTFTYA